MKVLVITGSPHRQGCSNCLAEQAMAGAQAAGHSLEWVDAAFANIHPCIGCNHCESGKHPCIYQDDMTAIYPKIERAEALIYATPLYYHAASAQFLTLIDRYHGIDAHIRGTHKKCILLVTGSNPDPSYMDGMRIWFQTDMRYLGWQAAGAVYAHGCTTAAQLKETAFAQEAYRLGYTL